MLSETPMMEIKTRLTLMFRRDRYFFYLHWTDVQSTLLPEQSSGRATEEYIRFFRREVLVNKYLSIKQSNGKP